MVGRGGIECRNALDKVVTWRSIIRIGLVWADEYTLLGLGLSPATLYRYLPAVRTRTATARDKR
jgi:hypothetical protein